MRRFCLLVVVFLINWSAAAHAAPAPADTLRPTSPVRYLRYTYANDLFFGTDYYFTQGMTLALVHPALARWPTHRPLLRGPAGSTRHHGIALRYDGFTPLRIQDGFVRVGDRPYAAYLYASFFRTSRAGPSQPRLTTAVEVGFIGPAAGGKELQTRIHRATGNPEPRGWDHQIRNDAIVGYRVGYEQPLLAAPGIAELLGTGDAALSTLNTYIGTGVRLRAGRAGAGTEPGERAAPGRWRLSAEISLEGRLIGYDATLQGGVFNRSSPYTLAAGEVRRAVLRSVGGVRLAHNGLQLAATATWLTPEFVGGRAHRWGQLGLTVAL